MWIKCSINIGESYLGIKSQNLKESEKKGAIYLVVVAGSNLDIKIVWKNAERYDGHIT